MNNKKIAAVALLCVAFVALSDASSVRNGVKTEVTWLPGWPKGKALPTRTFSGYLDITDGLDPSNDKMLLHYMAFMSENDPATDPVLLWSNGGPGATSVWGLFVENGPLLLNLESVANGAGNGTAPTLIENPYSWTKFATVIAFEYPPPVGFSYCTPPGPPGNGSACGVWNDTRVGVVLAQGLEILFTDHFPRMLATSPLFIAGESYAGVFLGETLRVMLANGTRFGRILQRLQGLALGDACLGSDVLCGGANGQWFNLLYLYGHAQFPTTLWKELLATCGGETVLRRPGPYSAACEAVISRVNTAVGGYFVYNLYDRCPANAFATLSADGSSGPIPKRRDHAMQHHAANRLRQRSQTRVATPWHRRREFDPVSVSSGADGKLGPVPSFNGYWCSANVFGEYMNRADVRAALGVPIDKNFFNGDDAVGLPYIFNCKTVMPTIAALIENTTGIVGHPVQVVAYDGDADPSVNVFITQEVWTAFAAERNYTVTSSWSPWVFGDNLVAGYNTQWTNGTLQFTTFRGAGHMVAEFVPLPAQVFAYAFVSQTKLPPWNPNGP